MLITSCLYSLGWAPLLLGHALEYCPTPLHPGKYRHIVPCGKFHRIGGATPKTFPSENYDAPEEVGGDRKCFDSPIRKLGLI